MENANEEKIVALAARELANGKTLREVFVKYGKSVAKMIPEIMRRRDELTEKRAEGER